MTEQARIQAFQAIVQAAAARFGVNLTAETHAEQLGPVVQVRAVLRVEVLADWTPPSRTSTTSAAPSQS